MAATTTGSPAARRRSTRRSRERSPRPAIPERSVSASAVLRLAGWRPPMAQSGWRNLHTPRCRLERARIMRATRVSSRGWRPTM
eukprot:694561-Prymnesium_polylepis.1